MIGTLRRAFQRHEFWAIKAAVRLPWLSIFMFGTLAVWAIVPSLIITLGLAFSGWEPLIATTNADGAESTGSGVTNMVTALFATILGLILVIRIIPWFFRWYFCCAGLMLGKGVMAQRKLSELETKLKAAQT